MGRFYTVVMKANSVSIAKDLMTVSAPATSVVVLHQAVLSQDASETSEQLPMQIHRVGNDGQGTVVTARKTLAGDAAFGGTSNVNLTTDTTEGDILWRESQNILNGWNYFPTPEMRFTIPPDNEIAIRLDTAPTAALTLTLSAVIEEIG